MKKRKLIYQRRVLGWKKLADVPVHPDGRRKPKKAERRKATRSQGEGKREIVAIHLVV